MASEKTEKQTDETPQAARRTWLRRLLLIGGGISVAFLVALLIGAILFKSGAVDGYVRSQLDSRLSEMGMSFESEAFRLSASPLGLTIRNASFKDKTTGEKLFDIREAHIGMTILDALSLRTSRDIRIDKTEISGGEVWIKFDENGRSNFSNIKLVEERPAGAVNFRYESVNFSLADSIVHFGDQSRRISGDAKNIVFSLSPEHGTSAAEKRYSFNLGSTNSSFTWDERKVESIDILAIGIADNKGAEVSRFELKTPVGESTLTGTISDWVSPKYAFDIQTSIDMTQTSHIFSPGSSVTGVGNFKGKVTGEGENYRIEGEADSGSLRAGDVSLKAFNVAATIAGTNSNYEANGTAVAEMLTFEDFKVDFLKLVGNVRGTGSDFRWWGELQAAAAKSTKLGLGGLYLSDARAEMKDRQLRADVANGRAKKFSIGDTEFADLRARDLKLGISGDDLDISSPTAQAHSFITEDYRIDGVTGRGVSVKRRKGETHVNIAGVRSDSAEIRGNKATGVSADDFRFTDLPRTTSITAKNLRAERVDTNGAVVRGLDVPTVKLDNSPNAMIVYADRMRVASVDAGSAVIGSLNIGGVRLTVKQGRLEVRSNDFDAGDVALKKTRNMPEGGKLEAVKVEKPVFILEPSGRYRVTADMSLGGGAVGSVPLGAARAKVDVNNNRVALNELIADVMEGQLKGNAVIATDGRSKSELNGDFLNLDIAKIIAFQWGNVTPIDGQTSGNVSLTFNGTDFKNASGTVSADITANAGNADRGLIPVSGKVSLSALDGLFSVDRADLATDRSKLTATGRFDLNNEDSDLTMALRSSDASEVDRLVRVLDASPELERQLDSLQITAAGSLTFDGKVNGNFYDPTVNGKADLELIAMRGRDLGSVSANVMVSPSGVDLTNGRLQERGGGNAEFTINIPYGGENNVTVDARLNGVNAGNVLAALPIDLPERIRDLDGRTTGSVKVSGLPNNADGRIDLVAAKGVIAGQVFDDLKVTAGFSGTRIELKQAEMRLDAGRLTANGGYDRASTAFDIDLGGQAVPMPLLLALFPRNDSMPSISGNLNFTAKANGFYDRTQSYIVYFDAAAPNVQIGDTMVGQIEIKGKTEDQVLTAGLTAILDGRSHLVNASVDLSNEDLPLKASTNFDRSPIAPFIAFIPQLKGIAISGTGTGHVEFGGNLRKTIDQGDRIFTSDGLNGKAEFSQLALQIQETPLTAAEPILIRFNTREVVFDKARFAGGGSDMTIAGAIAFTNDGINNLTIDGRVNLNLVNLFVKDTFFTGFAVTRIGFQGPSGTAMISGSANFVNASIATFIGSDRFTFERIKARVIFTSNQVEVEEASGSLGGGKFSGNGGGTLDGFAVKSFRFTLDGRNVTLPLPKDFTTTGDAQLEITGIRPETGGNIQLKIGGNVYAKRAVYSKDIDLANLVSGRHSGTLAASSGSANPPRFELVIEGRDALIVKNNIADLTASVSLALTGDANEPRLSGRIAAHSGSINFRKEHYLVQRGVLEFPPDTAIDPVINLQAEADIAGYQVFVSLSGPLKDSELLSANVRSSPALPQADVVSLITTGSLTNTAGGIPMLAQTGINTAAEILTDTIINNPARKATDKLFGLNVFEIDPLISGQQLNPSARLTVGRQINNNLRITYATNLSQDQNQVLAFEYRVSDKLSFVAQYEQRSLSNVTRYRDNFSFEVRFRKRF